jgi:hypothetical protein
MAKAQSPFCPLWRARKAQGSDEELIVLLTPSSSLNGIMERTLVVIQELSSLYLAQRSNVDMDKRGKLHDIGQHWHSRRRESYN